MDASFRSQHAREPETPPQSLGESFDDSTSPNEQTSPFALNKHASADALFKTPNSSPQRYLGISLRHQHQQQQQQRGRLTDPRGVRRRREVANRHDSETVNSGDVSRHSGMSNSGNARAIRLERLRAARLSPLDDAANVNTWNVRSLSGTERAQRAYEASVAATAAAEAGLTQWQIAEELRRTHSQAEAGERASDDLYPAPWGQSATTDVQRFGNGVDSTSSAHTSGFEDTFDDEDAALEYVAALEAPAETIFSHATPVRCPRCMNAHLSDRVSGADTPLSWCASCDLLVHGSVAAVGARLMATVAEHSQAKCEHDGEFLASCVPADSPDTPAELWYACGQCGAERIL